MALPLRTEMLESHTRRHPASRTTDTAAQPLFTGLRGGSIYKAANDSIGGSGLTPSQPLGPGVDFASGALLGLEICGLLR